MSYIKDLRKYVGHNPILTAGVGLLVFNNKNQECFANTILEIIMLNIMNELLDKKISYNFILDNFDTIVNKEEILNLLNLSSSDIESIVAVRNLEKITDKTIFDKIEEIWYN